MFQLRFFCRVIFWQLNYNLGLNQGEKGGRGILISNLFKASA